MKAAICTKGSKILTIEDRKIPEIFQDQILIRVEACGLCRTDIHIIDGELELEKDSRILGHQVVGTVAKVLPGETRFHVGDRVGAFWLGKSCGDCNYCRENRENLCDHPLFTGYTLDGGFAEYMVAFAAFVVLLPKFIEAKFLAPLLCAGLIGYRSYKKASHGANIGIYGFGSAGHLILQIAKAQGKKVYVFTKSHDEVAKSSARNLGADWVGSSEEILGPILDSAVIFASDGNLVPIALKNLRKGGVCVCGGIHMTDIPSFPYVDLWGERKIVSVANLCRSDAKEFFDLVALLDLQVQVQTYPLVKINEAVEDLRSGRIARSLVITF